MRPTQHVCRLQEDLGPVCNGLQVPLFPGSQGSLDGFVEQALKGEGEVGNCRLQREGPWGVSEGGESWKATLFHAGTMPVCLVPQPPAITTANSVPSEPVAVASLKPEGPGQVGQLSKALALSPTAVKLAPLSLWSNQNLTLFLGPGGPEPTIQKLEVNWSLRHGSAAGLQTPTALIATQCQLPDPQSPQPLLLALSSANSRPGFPSMVSPIALTQPSRIHLLPSPRSAPPRACQGTSRLWLRQLAFGSS